MTTKIKVIEDTFFNSIESESMEPIIPGSNTPDNTEVTPNAEDTDPNTNINAELTPSELDKLFNEDAPVATPPEGTAPIVDEATGEPVATTAPATTEESDEGISSTVSTFNYLKENGLVEYEGKEGEDITEDMAAELIENSYEARVKDKLTEVLNSIPEELKDLNTFVMEGGNIQDYLSLNKTSQVGEGMDLTTVTNQKRVMTEALTEQGYDAESIETQIAYLEDSGNLEKMATSSYKVITGKLKKAKDKLVQTQLENNRKVIASEKKFKSDLSKAIDGTKEIKGFTFTPQEKRELKGYMTNKTIKVQGRENISPMYADLHDALNDETKMILLGKLLKSDFDFSGLAKASETAATKNIKDKIQNSKVTPKRSSTPSSSQLNNDDLIALLKK